MAKQQTILIAGATGNIGRAAAVALARRGARVVLLGRNREKLEGKANGIREELDEANVTFQDSDIDMQGEYHASPSIPSTSSTNPILSSLTDGPLALVDFFGGL